MTVQETLRLAPPGDREFGARFERVAHWFPVLGQRFRRRAGTLYGGEQKMLIVARGMLIEPRVFLLGEVAEGFQPSVRGSAG